MARINIDDELHADDRFKDLVKHFAGDEDKAVGLLYRFWHKAQDYWGKECALMPFEEFIDRGFAVLLERKTAFAIRDADGVKATGSETRFAWHLQRCRASRKGVKARLDRSVGEDGDDSPGNGGKKKRPGKDSGQPEHADRSTGSDASNNPTVPAPASVPATATIIVPAPASARQNAENGKPASGDLGGQSNPAVIARLIGSYSRFADGLKSVTESEDLVLRREKLRAQARALLESERSQGHPGAFTGTSPPIGSGNGWQGGNGRGNSDQEILQQTVQPIVRARASG